MMDRAELRAAVSRHRVVVPIAAFAFLLMVFGTWRLQPHLTIPDETGAIERALQIGYEQDLFIDDFKKGGNLHLYLLAVSFVPVVVIWVLTGRFGEITSAASGLQSPDWTVSPELLAAFYDVMFAGRLLSVLFGVGTVVVVYFVGVELRDRRTGAIAAALLSVSVGYVMVAHYATEDVPMTFFLALTLYLAIRAFDEGSERLLLATAFAMGLATSAKALAGLLVVPVAILFLYHYRETLSEPVTFVRQTWYYPLVSLAAYVLTTPSIFVHPGSWYGEVSRYASTASGGNVVYELPDPGWAIQLAHLAQAQSLPLFVFSLASVAIVVTLLLTDRIGPAAWLPVAFAVPYFTIISVGRMAQFPRVLPLLVVFAILGGLAATSAIEFRPRYHTVATGAVALLFVFGGAYTGIAVADFNDSRAAATEWNHENLPDGAQVDVHSQRVYLPEFPDRVDVNRTVIHSTYPEAQWRPALSRLDCARAEYVVLSSYHYDRFFTDRSAYPAVTERFDRLLDERGAYEITATFGPPIDRNHTAAARFGTSYDLERFPEDGNPTIVILERTGQPVADC